jgi:hypothetical protein
MSDRPRSIADDIIDAVESATSKWTRQRKSEERHPGNLRYRVSRMTKEPRTTQKEAAAEVLEQAYMAASSGGQLPAKARQIYYQARPKVMALTDDRELAYGYFSQDLLPDYIEEHGLDWDVVYDARGHFEEPHTNRSIGCGTLEVRNYLDAITDAEIEPTALAGAHVETIGPDGNIAAVLYVEKEGFNPLFKAVNLANRYDLMIISNKGQSVIAGRRLVDEICGEYNIPLFVLHDFDYAGFEIFGTLGRDTDRYQFSNTIDPISLGLRLEDIHGLEREPAASSKVGKQQRTEQLRKYGAAKEEIAILLDERVELNALTSDALVDMIERKLAAHGLKKVIPDSDALAETYRALHRDRRLRKAFKKIEKGLREEEVAIPDDLGTRVEAILAKEPSLRWDEAVELVLDKRQLRRVLDRHKRGGRSSRSD